MQRMRFKHEELETLEVAYPIVFRESFQFSHQVLLPCAHRS